jgi:MFS family permease
MAITSLAAQLTHLLLAGSFIGFGYGFCLPALQTLAIIKSPPQRRGAATGTFFVAFDVGIGLGTVLWGYVAALTGYHLMFLSTLIPLAVSAITYYYYVYKKIASGF